MRVSCAIGALMGGGLVLLAAGGVTADPPCLEQAYTLTAEFTDEFWVNLDTGAGDRVQVRQLAEPLPYIWVAKSGANRIVRIDTDTGDVLGEYRSAPADLSGNPSRTTVDLFGNVWAGNRDEAGDGLGSVVKIGLVVGGTRVDAAGTPDADGEYLEPPFDYCTCVDRDSDGRIHTSRPSVGYPLAWPDVTDGQGGDRDDCQAAGPALVEDAEDECILVYQRVNGTKTRHVSVDANNNVWVGTKEGGREFDLLDGETGAILASFSLGYGGYGGLVDGNGVLWSSTPGAEHTILRYDTNKTVTTDDDTWTVIDTPHSYNSYGLGLDAFGNIWSSQWKSPASSTVNKLSSGGSSYFSGGLAYTGGDYDRGITVTPADSHAWMANSGGGLSEPDGSNQTVTRVDNDGLNPVTIDLGVNGRGPTGVSVDANGKVWVSCYTSDRMHRIDPSDNTVDLVVNLGAGANPYNYSDMTGMVGLLALKYGMWTAVHDSGVGQARWSRVTWNTEACASPHEPAGTSIRVQVRAAETEAGLTREDFVEVYNDVPMGKAAVGRFVQVRAILNGTGYDVNFETPVLCDLTVWTDAGDGQDCDSDGVPDTCEMDYDDCNLNCTSDTDDIAGGVSDDHNADGIPDECGQIIYVKIDATAGNNDGKTWADAFTNLQDALDAVDTWDGPVAQVWVADGTYVPSKIADPGVGRSRTFMLRSGVALYGGFAGDVDETVRAARDIAANETVLSGDINGDDVGFVNNGENVYHVVTATDADATAILDGFTISGGNSDHQLNGNGAGLYNIGSCANPTVRNCLFEWNDARYSGGGAYASEGSPTFEHCRFVDNEGYWGGGVRFYDAPAVVIGCDFNSNGAQHGGGADSSGAASTWINCTFEENEATGQGGGVRVRDADHSFTNCTFRDNTANSDGGGLHMQNGDLTLTNCTVTDNTADSGDGLYASSQDGGSTGTVTNCIFWANSNQEIGGTTTGYTVTYSDIDGGFSGTGNINDNPLFADAGGGDLRLLPGSPCIDVGNNDALPDDDYDLDGDGVMGASEQLPLDLDWIPRRVDDTETPDGGYPPGDSPYADMGAYEYHIDCDSNGIPDNCDLACGPTYGMCDVPDCGLASDSNGNAIPDECEPKIYNAYSCREHGDSPPTELCCEYRRPDGVEPRIGGVEKVKLYFDVELDPATVSSANVSVECAVQNYTNGTVTPVLLNGGKILVLTFDPDLNTHQDCCTIDLDGMKSDHYGYDVFNVFKTGVLYGNVNMDMIVNTVDSSAVKARFGQSADASNCQYDVNTDGVINTVDFSAIKIRFGDTMPECP